MTHRTPGRVFSPGPQAPLRLEPDTHCAWVAPPRDEPQNPWVTMLWHSALRNPRPQVEVASLEVVSLFSHVRYTLAAVTTETGPVEAPVTPETTAPWPRGVSPTVVRFRLADADDGTPVAGARAQASILKDGDRAAWDIVRSDARGEAFLDFPPRVPRTPIEILATGPYHVATRFVLQPDSDTVQQFNLHRGQTVGGKVVDGAGRPVPGAVVTIAGPQDDGSGGTFFTQSPEALTDTNGVWSLGCVPAGFSRLIITLHPSKCLAALIYEQDDTGDSLLSFRAPDLAQRKLVFRVPPPTQCQGSVSCAQGAVAGAEVTLFCGDTPRASRVAARTDKDGRFAFAGLEAAQASLLVVADGFSPVLQSVTVSTNPVAVALEPGRTIEAVAQDDSGRPLAQTLFQVTSWNGNAWLEHFGFSDASGKFRWDSAPAGPVNFCVYRLGFRPLRDMPLAAGSPPRVFTLEPGL